jgi:hypothetical protein
MPLLTLQGLIDRVYARLDNNQLLYPTYPVVVWAINEAIQVLNLQTGFIQTTLQVPGWSQQNRVWYDVPAGIVIPTRVQFESTYLQPATLNGIGQTYPNWTGDTTANTGLPVAYWIPAGLNKFAIYPADALGGQDIRVTGVAEPAPLVNLTDAVPMPNEYVSAFDLLAAHTLQLKESSAMFAQSSTDYQAYMRTMKKAAMWRGMVQPRYFVEAQQPKGT